MILGTFLAASALAGTAPALAGDYQDHNPPIQSDRMPFNAQQRAVIEAERTHEVESLSRGTSRMTETQVARTRTGRIKPDMARPWTMHWPAQRGGPDGYGSPGGL